MIMKNKLKENEVIEICPICKDKGFIMCSEEKTLIDLNNGKNLDDIWRLANKYNCDDFKNMILSINNSINKVLEIK